MNSINMANAVTPDGEEVKWTPWTPREEIRPRFSVEDGAVLKIEGSGNPAAYGAWSGSVEGIVAGKTYRFTASLTGWLFRPNVETGRCRRRLKIETLV